MVRSILVVIAAICTLQCVRAACDPKTIDKIKELTKGMDDKDILNKIQGTYDFKLASFGAASSVFTKDCLSAKFSGKYVEYTGAAEGKFEIKYEDGKLVVIDEDGEVVFYTYMVYIDNKYKVLSLYTCSPGDAGTTFYFSGVAVDRTAMSTATPSLEEAKAALSKIGVNDLVTVAPCRKI